jgi:hypothetical protein
MRLGAPANCARRAVRHPHAAVACARARRRDVATRFTIRATARSVLDGPPESYQHRECTGAVSKAHVAERYPELADLVEAGVLHVVLRPADYKERRVDGYQVGVSRSSPHKRPPKTTAETAAAGAPDTPAWEHIVTHTIWCSFMHGV